MTRQRLLLAAALALGVAACGKSAAPDFAAGTPDAAGLTLETTGGTGDGLTASGGGAGALSVDASAAALAPCQFDYEYTCNIRQAIVGVNRYIRAALEPVEALVAAGPSASPSDDVRVYGPAPLPAPPAAVANFRLTVKFIGDETYRWKLEAQPLAPPNAPFQVVMAGQLHRGDLPHRGHGVVGIDLDALHAVNAAAFAGQGKLLAAFAHVGLQKALVFAAKAFSADGVALPVSAVFTAWKDALGRARVRLAAAGEFVPPAGGGVDAGDELLLSRIGYWPAVGGRTVVAVVLGDVPSYGSVNFDVKAVVGAECFGAGIAVTYRARFVCGTNLLLARDECFADTAFNTSGAAVGTDPNGVPAVGACVPNTDVYDGGTGPGTDPNSTDLEPGAPVTPPDPLPSAMPAF